MATLSATVPTLLDLVKEIAPDGSILPVANLLAQTNEVVGFLPFMEANGVTGHTIAQVTGLPEVYYRILNQGTPLSTDETKNIVETMAMLDAWSEVDVKMVELAKDKGQYRLNRAQRFIEAMGQAYATKFFYGNTELNPEEPMGLATRYNDSSAGNAQNLILAGGAGSDNTSIWMGVAGPTSLYGIYPQGSRVGLDHEDLGIVTSQQGNTVADPGRRLRVYQDHYVWDHGFALEDWRYVVRIANIDVSVATGDYDGSDGFTFDLLNLMSRGYHRIQNLGMGKPFIFMNRTMRQVLDIQANEKVKGGGGLTYDNVDGQVRTSFRGMPIYLCDAITNSETLVS